MFTEKAVVAYSSRLTLRPTSTQNASFSNSVKKVPNVVFHKFVLKKILMFFRIIYGENENIDRIQFSKSDSFPVT